MDLQELLDSVGLNKVQLAKLMGVSRSTVMRMGDRVSDEVLIIIDQYRLTDIASETIPLPNKAEPKVTTGQRVKEPQDYTPKEIKLLCLRRGTGQEPDHVIAASIGVKLYEFKAMIVSLVKHCQTHSITSASLV